MKRILQLVLILSFFNLFAQEQWKVVSKTVAPIRSLGMRFGSTVSINGSSAVISAPYTRNAIDEGVGALYFYEKTNNNWVLKNEFIGVNAPSRRTQSLGLAQINGNVAIAVFQDWYYLTYHTVIYSRQLDGSWFQSIDNLKLDNYKGVKMSKNHYMSRTKIYPHLSTVYKADLNQNDPDVLPDDFGDSYDIGDKWVAIGAPKHDKDESGFNPINDAGAVYTYLKGASDVWVPQGKIVASDRKLNMMFGHNISIDGEYIVVSSQYESNDELGLNPLSDAGAVYVFKRENYQWNQVQKIVPNDRKVDDRFGYQVAIKGKYIVVSSRNDLDANGLNFKSGSGSIYIFRKEGEKWIQSQKIVAIDRDEGDGFGNSISLTERHLIVGSSEDDHNENNQLYLSNAGSVYFYELFCNDNPLPNAYVGDDALICNGSSMQLGAIPVEGNSYSWSSIPEGYTSTSANPIVNPTVTTTYTLTETNIATGCSTSNSIKVSVFPPLLNSTSPGSRCGAGTVVLSVSSALSTTVSWYSAPTGGTALATGTSFSRYVSYTTTFYVEVRNSITGCITPTRVPVVATINSVLSSAGVITGTAIVCKGQNNVSFTVPSIADASSYIWSYSGTGATIVGTTNNVTINFSSNATSGNLTVRGTNACGNGAVSTNYAITVNNKPTTPVISQNSDVLQSNVSLGNQWYDENGPIIGATNQYYTVTTNGNYYVIVNLSGCSSESSNVINITSLSVEFNDDIVNKIYPNPVLDELFIELQRKDELVNYEIYNVKGQVVFKGTFVEKTTVPTSNLAPGMYMLKLENGKSYGFKKIIKK